MLYYTVKDPQNRIKAQFLVCGYENGLIQFIDDSLQGSYNKNFEIKAHRSRVIDLKICENGDSQLRHFLISFSYDNSILFIKLETLRIELTYIFEFQEKGIFNCLDFFEDFLIFGCEDGYLRFFHFEDSKLKFLCQKHYLPEEQRSASDFRTINTLKVFEDLLLVADNFGGLVVLDLHSMILKLKQFESSKKKKLDHKLGKASFGSKSARETEKLQTNVKKNLYSPDFNFCDFGLDIDFDWLLIFIEQCHFQKIVKIMDLDGQAILTSGNDCKTKLWVIERKGAEGVSSRKDKRSLKNISKK